MFGLFKAHVVCMEKFELFRLKSTASSALTYLHLRRHLPFVGCAGITDKSYPWYDALVRAHLKLSLSPFSIGYSQALALRSI